MVPAALLRHRNQVCVPDKPHGTVFGAVEVDAGCKGTVEVFTAYPEEAMRPRFLPSRQNWRKCRVLKGGATEPLLLCGVTRQGNAGTAPPFNVRPKPRGKTSS